MWGAKRHLLRWLEHHFTYLCGRNELRRLGACTEEVCDPKG